MKIRFGIWALIATSFFIRLIQANLNYTPLFGDEWVLSSASLNMMMTGTLKNIFFGYGDVCKIPYLLIDVVTFLIGAWRGIYASVSSVLPFEDFVFANRLFNVTLGALSIGVAYRLGVKIATERLGWILALLTFANPLQFKYSLYSNPDETAFFFMLFSMVFALDIASKEDKEARKGYLFSAICIALSIGAKVNHMFAILFPLMIHFYVRPGNLIDKTFNLNLIKFGGALAGTYFLVSPTVLLSFPTFFDFWLRFFFGTEMNLSERQVYEVSQFSLLFEEIRKVLGTWTLFGLACFGILGFLRKREHQVILFIGLALTYFFSTVIHANTSYRVDAHALFPLLPFILIFTGMGIDLSVRLVQSVLPFLKGRALPLIATLILIFFPLNKSILNSKIDYTYLGGNNKESFWDYFLKGVKTSQAAPLNPIAKNEMNQIERLPVTLKGNESEWGVLLDVNGKEAVEIEFEFDSETELLPSLATVSLSYLDEVQKKKFVRHRRNYLLEDVGHWNWRQLGVSTPIKVGEEGDVARIPLEILERGKIVLVRVSLKSPYQTGSLQLKRVELK